MTLMRWQHRGPLADIFNNFFENEFMDFWSKRSTDPGANIIETDNSFVLELAAPGMKKEDFKISLENNILTVSAELNDEKREEGRNYTRKEFYYGSFSRSFTLPRSIDLENIKADYVNGVLNVSLPKKEEAKVSLKKDIRIS